MSLDSLLQIKGDTLLIRCVICTISQINLHHKNDKQKILYDFKEVSFSEALPAKLVRYDKSVYQDIELPVKEVESERYISDLHFAKEGTFYHKIKNNLESNSVSLVIQEYFPKFLRPFIHTLKVAIKEVDSGKITQFSIGSN